MESEHSELHMVSLLLDGQALVRLGHRLQLPAATEDLGYLVHCLLGELFGDLAPTPFAVKPRLGRGLPVLGYSTVSASALQEAAQATAAPVAWNACDWGAFAGKPMPAAWSAGTEYRFSTRVCPVVRMADDGPRHRKGAEVDAFLRRCWQVGDDTAVSREEVYRTWLREELDRRGGAEVIEAGLTRFQRARLIRRGRARGRRRSHVVERPDATLEGRLKIGEPGSFANLLARGLGRHRGFGFGMLLLQPAG